MASRRAHWARHLSYLGNGADKMPILSADLDGSLPRIGKALPQSQREQSANIPPAALVLTGREDINQPDLVTYLVLEEVTH